MLDQMVIKKCSAAMQADFDKAGKTPPTGLIQKTCGCVAQQLDATHNPGCPTLLKHEIHATAGCGV
jgi:hypothetical protein